MRRVEKRVEVPAPVSEVFAYVDDVDNAGEWLYGLTRIVPVGEVEHGVGAQYDGAVRVGVPLHSRIECTGWEQDRLIELTSVAGIHNTQRWEFRPLGERRCEVYARVDYDLPGGPAGKVIERAVSPVVGIAVQHTADALVARFAS